MLRRLGAIVAPRLYGVQNRHISLSKYRAVEDNSLGMSTLTSAFPGSHGLKYKNPKTGASRALMMFSTGSKFFSPSDGGNGKTFTVRSPPALDETKQPNLGDESNTKEDEEADKQKNSGTSCQKKHQSESVVKAKMSDTEMKCRECEFTTRSASSFVFHLKDSHNTTIRLSGLALRCECGDESYSHHHRYKCDIANFRVIQEKDRPIIRLHDGFFLRSWCPKTHHLESASKVNLSDTEMECPECEYYTRSASSFVGHLGRKHNTNIYLSGLALLCECGNESYSHNHSYQCNIANFRIIRKREGPIIRLHDEKVAPQCILCEAFPKTSNGYATHLRQRHNSSLKENGIFLLCSCGLEVFNEDDRKHHKDCNRRFFTLKKLDQN